MFIPEIEKLINQDEKIRIFELLGKMDIKQPILEMASRSFIPLIGDTSDQKALLCWL